MEMEIVRRRAENYESKMETVRQTKRDGNGELREKAAATSN